MDLKSLGQTLAKLGLPLIGAALPIPGGAAIGAALASVIGAKSDDPSDILAALTGNAQAMLQAKQFEATHQETMLKLTLDAQTAVYQADASDRASARARAVEMHDWTPNAIGILVLLFCFGTEAYVLMRGLPPGIDAGLSGRILGGLDTAATLFLTFMYGSNRDSQRKTQMIADVGNAAASAPINIQAAAAPLPAPNTTTTTVQTPTSSPQSVTVTPASDEQSYAPTPGTQGDIYQGS